MEENIYRSVYCGKVDRSYIGKEVRVCGWVNSIRNLGSLLFITLRDETGIVQLISEESDKFINLTKESTVTVSGTVRKRDDDMINKNMATGEIEIVINTLDILGLCENVLPFEISRSKESLEDTRLKYRYLDLRNESVHNNILFRSKVIDFIRETMKSMGFTEIQTPIITATSPEGARDFIVPSRKFKGKFYALPQAPQIFKQLLMVSGFDKYFQIAPCFRDEDPRSDRLYGEFYQLDFEMSFVTEEDVYKVGEKVFYNVFTNFSEKEVSKPPFRRIPYREAMLKYGSDKPDLRNPLIIQDVSKIFETIEFNAFKGKIVRAIVLPKQENLSRKFYDGMVTFAIEDCKAKGLSWVKVNEGNVLQGSIAKFIDDVSKDNLLKELGAKEGDSIFFVSDEKGVVEKLAGQIRTELAVRLDLLEKDSYKFCWVIDFPMYELDDDGNIAFSHNPFSMPQGGLKALEEKEPLDILAYQYDLVCNGIELSSGAVRNHDPEIMIKAFEIAGYSKKHIEEKFPAMFNAFHYGAPPHAGIAPGIDRIIMLIANEVNIREVIAFPMNSKAQDLLMGAPGTVTEKQLKDVHIKIDVKE